MRTTVIPAQITTVEDKIAGNLNLAQIILLVVPVIWATVVYTIVPPVFKIAWFKVPIVLVAAALCTALALRIKGKVVISWLGVLLKYNMRPKYWVYNKNDAYLRDLYLPEFEKKKKLFNFSFKFHKAPKKKEIRIKAKDFGIKDLLALKDFIHNPNYQLSLKPDSKGGLYVYLREITK